MKYNPAIVAAYYKQSGLPAPVFEYRFHPTRKWRLDIAWTVEKVAVEVQGGIWGSSGKRCPVCKQPIAMGRHTRGAAMLKEWEKLNELAGMGWRVLYCQPKDVCTDEMVAKIKKALKGEA